MTRSVTMASVKSEAWLQPCVYSQSRLIGGSSIPGAALLNHVEP